ncbi:MAG TPA: four helix bundle protein [Pyrinomonadaceae bacterium]|nr:four helix bundle protein [Pyrinomonadaceae bacterium]
MATFKKFEDILAWQKARKATRQVYEATKHVSFAKDFGLRDQIQRASVSIMANIAEGFGRHSDREFANFLNIAHASVSEIQSHLYVALALGYVSENAFRSLYDQFDEVSRMTLALSVHLRTTKAN